MSNDTSFEDAFNELAGVPAQEVQEPQEIDTSETGDPTPEPQPEPQAATLDAEPLADSGTPAPAEPAPEVAVAPKPQPDPNRPRKLQDMLDYLPESERDTYRAMIGEVLDNMHRLKSDSGRVSAMQRLYEDAKARESEMQQRMAELESKAQQATTHAQKAEVAKEAQQIADEKDELDEEFPELSKSVNLRIERMLKKVLPAQQSAAPAKEEPRQQPVSDTPKADDAEVTALQKEFVALNERHPNWQKAVNTEAFKVWFQRQPATTQELFGSKSARDAILLMDQFEHAVAQARAQREAETKTASRKRLEQSVGIKGAPSRATAVPDDFESAFNFYANQR